MGIIAYCNLPVLIYCVPMLDEDKKYLYVSGLLAALSFVFFLLSVFSFHPATLLLFALLTLASIIVAIVGMVRIKNKSRFVCLAPIALSFILVTVVALSPYTPIRMMLSYPFKKHALENEYGTPEKFLDHFDESDVRFEFKTKEGDQYIYRSGSDKEGKLLNACKSLAYQPVGKRCEHRSESSLYLRLPSDSSFYCLQDCGDVLMLPRPAVEGGNVEFFYHVDMQKASEVIALAASLLGEM